MERGQLVRLEKECNNLAWNPGKKKGSEAEWIQKGSKEKEGHWERRV